MGDDGAPLLNRIADSLRLDGVRVDVVLDGPIKKIKKIFGRADRDGIPFVGIIGDAELEMGAVKIKDLNTGEETVVKGEREELRAFFQDTKGTEDN